MTANKWDIAASTRKHVLLSLAGAIFLGLVVGGWANTMELSGAVIAPGVLVAKSSVKKVQHPTGGVVGRLPVHDGDFVRAGQLLLRLDETITKANLAIVDNSLIELYSRLARLEAERDGLDRVDCPKQLCARANEADVAKALAGESTLFQLRKSARAGQKAQLRERIGQIAQEIEGLNGQIAAKNHELELIDRELGGVRELWRKSLIPIQRLTALERDAARLQGEHGQLIASVAQAKGRTSETELQIIQVDQDLRSEVGKELREVQGKIAELVEKRVTAEDQLKHIDILSPQDGVVHQLAVHTIGGFVAPGDAIMLIVPIADTLVTEAKVAPRDIDQVHVGQSAVLRFTAFNQRTTPELKGRVTFVSADQITDDKTGNAYFKVHIAPAEAELPSLGGRKLVSGMPAEAFIQTGERTALSYLLKPLRDQIARAFKEQ